MTENLQKLRMENGDLILDELKLKNVISFKLDKSSAESATELSLTLLVEDIRCID